MPRRLEQQQGGLRRCQREVNCLIRIPPPGSGRRRESAGPAAAAALGAEGGGRAFHLACNPVDTNYLAVACGDYIARVFDRRCARSFGAWDRKGRGVKRGFACGYLVGVASGLLALCLAEGRQLAAVRIRRLQFVVVGDLVPIRFVWCVCSILYLRRQIDVSSPFG